MLDPNCISIDYQVRLKQSRLIGYTLTIYLFYKG